MNEYKTKSIEETKLLISHMIHQTDNSDFHVATARDFIRNNPMFLYAYMKDKGCCVKDIQTYYDNELIVAEAKPNKKDFKNFCKLTFKTYRKGTKKLFVILNNVGDLKKQTEKGVTVLPISFRELLEMNLNRLKNYT